MTPQGSLSNSFESRASPAYLIGDTYCSQLIHEPSDEVLVSMPPERLTGMASTGALARACCVLSKEGEDAEQAAGALWHLTAGDAAVVRLVADAGAIPRLVSLMSSSSQQEAQKAGGAIQNLAACSEDLAEAVQRAKVAARIA